jgi:hypothetical protein
MDPFLDHNTQKIVRVLRDAIGKKGRYIKGILIAGDGSRAQCWVEIEKDSKPEYKPGDVLEVFHVSASKNSEILYTVVLEIDKPLSVTSTRSYNRTIKAEHAVYVKEYAKTRGIRFDGHYLNDAMHSMMDEIVQHDIFDLESTPDQ